jgi:hypothetical protein
VRIYQHLNRKDFSQEFWSQNLSGRSTRQRLPIHQKKNTVGKFRCQINIVRDDDRARAPFVATCTHKLQQRRLMREV